MKHVIHKPYFNWEKEEKWLNEMSAKGLALVRYTWCRYEFEDSAPGEYIYRIELLDYPALSLTSRRYIRFVEGTGAEFVSSYFRWVYFRKKAADGPFTLHSDIPSQISHSKKVRSFWLGLALLELSAGLLNVSLGLTPKQNWFQIVMGGLLFVMGWAFLFWAFQITRKIRRLRKEQLILDA